MVTRKFQKLNQPLVLPCTTSFIQSCRNVARKTGRLSDTLLHACSSDHLRLAYISPVFRAHIVAGVSSRASHAANNKHMGPSRETNQGPEVSNNGRRQVASVADPNSTVSERCWCDFGQRCPHMPRLGPMWVEICRAGPKVVPNHANVLPNRSNYGQSWPTQDQICPALAELEPSLARFGRKRWHWGDVSANGGHVEKQLGNNWGTLERQARKGDLCKLRETKTVWQLSGEVDLSGNFRVVWPSLLYSVSPPTAGSKS